MKTVLVDSNVLLDFATNDSTWSHWSSEAIVAAASETILAIEPTFRLSNSSRLRLALQKPLHFGR
jgi:hypothetical protein